MVGYLHRGDEQPLEAEHPNVSRLLEIAEALGVCVTDMFTYDTEESPAPDA